MWEYEERDVTATITERTFILRTKFDLFIYPVDQYRYWTCHTVHHTILK
jgi:hypothetical protein